jgi:hypothetical protein
MGPGHLLLLAVVLVAAAAAAGAFSAPPPATSSARARHIFAAGRAALAGRSTARPRAAAGALYAVRRAGGDPVDLLSIQRGAVHTDISV